MDSHFPGCTISCTGLVLISRLLQFVHAGLGVLDFPAEKWLRSMIYAERLHVDGMSRPTIRESVDISFRMQ